jgi:hypothetical protein
VFENRVLRKIFGPKRDEVTGGWRKLHNEELHKLYFSPGIMDRARRIHKNTYRILVGKSDGKISLGRPRRGRGNNNKMDLRGIGWGGVDWIDLAQKKYQWRALENTVMNIRVLLIL